MTVPTKYLLLSLLCFGAVVCYAKEPKSTPATVPASSTQILENKGQITDQYGKQRNDIDFKIENGGVTMFGGKGQLHYQWTKENPNKKSQIPNELSGASGHLPSLFSDTLFKEGIENTLIEIYRLDVTLVGANPNAEVLFEEPTGYYENYYLTQCPDGATTKGYNKITYKNIYPNIDWIIYTPPTPLKGREVSGIKYDFIVHPSGNPADIRLRYEGASDIKLTDGSLIATTPFGSITENAPYSYEAETKKEIGSGYILDGNELRFDVGKYTGKLVIDPYLRWGTYYGGSGEDVAYDVATSADGYVYICGATKSTGNIATTGAHRTTIASGTWPDAFIAKFDDSSRRKWATYYGGNNQELAYGITTDRQGHVFVCGSTGSDTGIATTGAHQVLHGNYPIPPNADPQLVVDGYLVKFDSGGQRIWGTYYGAAGTIAGKGVDHITDVACDKNNNVYICGYTNTPGSTNGGAISTSGSYQPVNVWGPDKYNGFVAKFSNNGVRQWGTYFADSNSQHLYAIACDGNNNVFVGGRTVTSLITNTMATSGAHQVTYGGNYDGILGKFNSNGVLQWCSYYGGSGEDVINGLTCDDTGNLYLTGMTASPNNISSPNAYDVTVNGNNAFLVKFNNNGVRQWGTYFGGARTYSTSIAICPRGRIFISGDTKSDTAIVTTGAYKTTLGGSPLTVGDVYLAEFTAGGQRLYSTYYGGAGDEGNSAIYQYMNSHSTIAASPEGIMYMASTTSSNSGIATTNGYQTTFGGNGDGFLTAWFTDTTVFIKQPYTDTVWCPGDTVKIVYGVNLPFVTGNSFTVQLSNASSSFASPVNIGAKTAIDKDTITCVIPLNMTAGTGYRIRVAGSNPVRVSKDNDWNIRIKANPSAFSNTSNSAVCTDDTLRLTGSSSSTGISWLWTGPNSFTSAAEDTFIANSVMNHAGDYILKATLNSTGCSLRDTTTVVMKQTPDKPVAASSSPVCETLSLQLTTGSSTTGVSYSWAGPSYSSTTQNPTVTNNAASTHVGDYISTVTLNGCSSRDTVTVVVLPKPAKPTAGAVNTSLCARQDLQLTASTVTGAGYTWLGPSSFAANIQNPVRPYVQMNHAGKYYVYATLNGCISDTDSVTIVVNTDPIVNIFPTPGTTICPGQQATFTAIPTNGGTAPTYQWRVNGIPTGGTAVSYNTTTLNNGDIVTCHMTSTTTCSTPFTDTSNAISMKVLPKMTPSVTITANPNTSLHPNEPISFTATPSQAGTAPTYQWRRNGKNVGGATGVTWGANANALGDGDEVCVLLKSSYQCPDPDTVLSNCIKLDIRLGVNTIINSENIKLYPNPNKGTFTLQGKLVAGNRISLEVVNAIGQIVFREDASSTKGVISKNIAINNATEGVYLLKIYSDTQIETIRFTIFK